MLKPFWSLCQGENVFFDFFKFKNEEKPKTINIFFLSQKKTNILFLPILGYKIKNFKIFYFKISFL